MACRFDQLQGALEDSAAGAAKYLASRFSSENGFPGREFYGLAFSVWLWSGYGSKYQPQVRAALELIRNDQRTVKDPAYHWEFVRFSLQYAFRESSLPVATSRDVLGRQRFVYSRGANWTLLRAVVRLHEKSGVQNVLGHIEAMLALAVYQTRGGVIEDARDNPTLQYHAFSAALLGLLIEKPSAMRHLYERRFRRAIEALDVFTLPGGEMNYVGRGQAQSFGYASAILAFCIAGKHFRDPAFLGRAAEIMERLRGFQRADGSFPLILRDKETVEGGPRAPGDPHFLGWYSYNNFFDYLPFTAALLRRSASVLAGMTDRKTSKPDRPQRVVKRRVDDFLIVRAPRYSAVVLPPKSYLSSAQPFPFLEIAGRYPLPCYGGEMKPPGLYTAYGLPLPSLIAPDGSRYFLDGGNRFSWTDLSSFTGEGSLLKLHRGFKFLGSAIEITDEIAVSDDSLGWRLEAPRILLYHEETTVQQSDRMIALPGLRIESDRPLSRLSTPAYCALGTLAVYVGTTDVASANFMLRTTVVLSLLAQADGEC